MKSRLASCDFWFYLLSLLLLPLFLIVVAVSQLMPTGRWGRRLHASYTKSVHGLFLALSVYFPCAWNQHLNFKCGRRREGNRGRCASIQPRVHN